MPQSNPSPVWPMLRAALLVLAVEVGLIAWVRRRGSAVASAQPSPAGESPV
jgi:hypothetical protein